MRHIAEEEMKEFNIELLISQSILNIKRGKPATTRYAETLSFHIEHMAAIHARGHLSQTNPW